MEITFGKKKFEFTFVGRICEANPARPRRQPNLLQHPLHAIVEWALGAGATHQSAGCLSRSARLSGEKIPNPSLIARCRAPATLAARICITTVPRPIALNSPSTATALLICVHASRRCTSASAPPMHHCATAMPRTSGSSTNCMQYDATCRV
jgi:hypothetical protein